MVILIIVFLTYGDTVLHTAICYGTIFILTNNTTDIITTDNNAIGESDIFHDT